MVLNDATRHNRLQKKKLLRKIYLSCCMTSIRHTYALGSRLPSLGQFVVCTYSGPDGYDVPFPWRFNRQTQAIDLEFVNGFNASSSLNDQPLFMRGQSLRAVHNVLALGPNFVAWAENSLSADTVSVVMTERPIICDANMVCLGLDPNSGATNSSLEPISFELSAGPLVSDYHKTMIFMKPLVIRYSVGGIVNYRYFSNNFEGNT